MKHKNTNMEDISITKIQISGPTLASILHHVSTSAGDISGLLFGHVTKTTPLTLSDDSNTTFFDQPTTIATISSFISSPSRHLDPTTLTTSHPSLIGWFSGRRKTHLRPSLRETSVSSSLALNNNSCIFLLLTTPFLDQLIHTHDYKVFHFRSLTDSFEAKGLDVVNLGPAFSGHYGSFTPSSLFPDLPFKVKGLNCDESMDEGDDEGKMENEKFGKLCDDEFKIGRLKRLMGSDAASYTAELEELYNSMIKKMNGLAKVVEQSSARVLEQENHNMKLRCKVAGLE